MKRRYSTKQFVHNAARALQDEDMSPEEFGLLVVSLLTPEELKEIALLAIRERMEELLGPPEEDA